MATQRAKPAADAATTPTPAATDWPADRYSGMAGRFVRNKATGERLPADQATAQAMVAAGIDKDLQTGGIRAVAPAADSQ